MNDKKDITTSLYGHQIILVSEAAELVVSVSGALDAVLLADQKLQVLEPPLSEIVLPTFGIYVGNIIGDDENCVLFDTDDGKRRILTVDTISKKVSGTGDSEQIGVAERFRIVMVGEKLCVIFSVSEQAWLSVDIDNNLDPDGRTFGIYANKKTVDSSCLFTFVVIS